MNEPRLPSGTVTFLFTDLEGSTRLWEASPRAMEQAVRRHDQILTEAIERTGGTVFKQVGDGLCAAFDAPAAAIEAAIEGQRALVAEPWPDGLAEPLRARMGIHTGTARAQDGDYLGPALNRVARLMSAGFGGQILMSAAAERLARDGLPDDVRLLDLGSHRLRDLSTPEQVFQVCHPDLAREFPPVRSVDSLPGNLPLQVTTFIGREEQLEQLATTVIENRLVTLTGVGGVGKTRLALQVASEVLPRYLDGAWLIELAPVGDPDAVPHAVAAVVGAQEVPNRTITESVVEALRPRQTLLIFDNCEHLLEAVGHLTEHILRACPHVTLLATSREPLAAGGERVWPVTSLAVPGRDEPADPEALAGIASVTLFVDRAQAARRDFVLTRDNAASIAEICRRLDGVALALELAAARVRSMAPSEIAARLDERFRLLRSGRRTAMERHQTLRATVEWSYGLLTEDERVLFDRVSVFAGGFILEAAEEVCAGDPIDELDVADLVASLTEKSMVGAEEQPDGTTRYVTLETIRQFGEEQLMERGEADDVGRRHMEYYARLASRVYAGTRGPDEARWVLVADLEFDNFRAAYAWASTNRALTAALSIPADLEPFASWRIRAEPFGWLDAALELPGAEDDAGYPNACAIAAMDAGMKGDNDRGDELAALALQGVTDDSRRAQAYAAMGSRGYTQDVAESIGHMTKSKELALGAGDLWSASFAACGEAMLTAYRGNPQNAIPLAEEARALAEKSCNPTARTLSLYTLGEVTQETDPVRARDALLEAIEVARSVNNRFVVGISLVALATVMARTGDHDGSLQMLRDALKEFRRRGSLRQQWVTLRNVVEEFEHVGKLEAAAVLYGATESDTAIGAAWGTQAERLAALRARLEETLGEAWSKAAELGSRLTPDEVVDYALAEIGRFVDERATARAGA